MSDGDYLRATNSFWTSQPSTGGRALTMDLFHEVFEKCSAQPMYGPSYIVTSKGTIEAAAPLGQTMIDAYFDRMAKDAARVIFGNLLPPLDAFTAGKYALGNEWPYEKSDDVEQDQQTVWDE